MPVQEIARRLIDGVWQTGRVEEDSGGSGTWVSSVLTNAEILALPTTPVELVPAPGDGMLLVVQSAVMMLDATGAAYSDFDTFAVFVNYGMTLKPASGNYLEADSGAFADDSAVHLLGVFLPTGSGTGNDATWFADRAEAENKPLTVFAGNGAAGDLGGGDPANSLTVYLNYTTIAL